MHSLLSRLLQKKGYNSVDELDKKPFLDGSSSEKQTFEKWDRILSLPDEVTIKDFDKFCQKQLSLIDEQMKNLDNSMEKNERLILLHNVYSTILKATVGTKLEREILEDYLQQLLK